MNALRVGLLIGLAIVASVAPAGAQVDETTVTRTDVIDSLVIDRTLLVVAGSQESMTENPRPGPGPGRRIDCAWFRVELGGIEVFDLVQVRRAVVGQTYVLWCWWHDTEESLAGHPIVAVYTGPGIPGLAADVDEVAAFALDSIDFVPPAPAINPPGGQVAGIETWLAVTSPLDYRVVHASAGPVWVSVDPRPTGVTWRVDDGTEIECAPGAVATEWDPEGPDAQSSECTHLYTAGGDEPRPVTATVNWEIWRRTFTEPAWAPWREFSLTTTTQVTVHQLQAAVD